MKAIFWTRQEVGHLIQSDWRETNLARALQNGAKAHGDEIEIRVVPDDGAVEVVECDLVCKIGVKSKHWFDAYRKAGIPWLYFDKGYIRTRAPIEWLDYWRLSVNGHHPINYVATAKNTRDRADTMDLGFSPWRSRSQGGRHIVVDGASRKNYAFNDLGDPTERAREVVEAVRGSGRPIIYRPKPSWDDKETGAVQIEGTEWARGRPGVGDKDFAYDLRRAHVVITYSSSLCFDAALFGVPSIVLGGAIARPISSTSLDDLENPRVATDAERRQWLSNVAWCQFKMAEYKDGTAWRVVRDMVACSR